MKSKRIESKFIKLVFTGVGDVLPQGMRPQEYIAVQLAPKNWEIKFALWPKGWVERQFRMRYKTWQIMLKQNFITEPNWHWMSAAEVFEELL